MDRATIPELVVIAIVVWAVSCRQTRELTREEFAKEFMSAPPPGTGMINEQFFADLTEVTNFYWLEYLFWLEQAHGRGSNEYRAALPDTSDWLRIEPPDSGLMVSYLRHPAYRDYPVVGVSHAQATNYSEWRSDRVFELLLIRHGVIRYQPVTSRASQFSIASFYVTDSLSAYHFLPYPEYGLPAVADRAAIMAIADSANAIGIRHCRFRPLLRKHPPCRDLFDGYRPKVNSIEHLDTLDRTKPISCYACDRPIFTHLIGNVRELCVDSAITLGGGWTDSLASMTSGRPYTSSGTNAWTGFRNVCRWRRSPKQ